MDKPVSGLCLTTIQVNVHLCWSFSDTIIFKCNQKIIFLLVCCTWGDLDDSFHKSQVTLVHP